jgi:apolipoprotein D and lipocalin family protein
VTAEYGLRSDGEVSVTNTCREGAVTGKVKVSEGRARIVEGAANAKLKVSFFGPFYFGDYWVLDRADDYSWSIVGEPSGKFLWLLSRTPQPGEVAIRALTDRAAALGYDTSMIRWTKHAG